MKFFFLGRFSVVFLCFFVFAEMATADADLDILKRLTTVDVAKTGIETRTISVEFKVKTEAGRLALTNFRTSFSGQPEYFKLREIYSLTKDVKTPTLQNEVKISEAQNNKLAQTDEKVAIIPIKNINAGSLVHISYSIISPPQITNHFSDTFELGYLADAEEDNYVFNFEIPIAYETYRLKELFDISESKSASGNQVITIRRKDQPSSSRRVGTIYFSSIKSWQSINRMLAKQYKAVWEGPLPPELEKIVSAAKNLKSLREQVNFVSARLNELVAYSGNWVTTRTKFLPQSFATTMQTKRGDCKDFATMLTAVLNKLSVKAFPALVTRELYATVGTDAFKVRSKLPSLSAFDHLIVTILTPDGKQIWADPTSPHVDIQYIPSDLVGKFALVLDGTTEGVTFLPEVVSEPSEINIEQNLKISGAMVEAKGSLIFKDLSQSQFTTLERLSGPEKIQTILNGWLNSGIKLPIVMGKKIEGSQTTYSFNYAVDKILEEKPNQYTAIILPNYGTQFGGVFTAGKPNFLGELGSIKIKTIVENSTAADIWELECSVKTKWADFDRTIENIKNNVVVTDILKIKKRMLSPEDIENPLYAYDVNEFSNCKGKDLVFTYFNYQSISEKQKIRRQKLGPEVDKMTSADADNLIKLRSAEPAFATDVEDKLLAFTRYRLEVNPQDIYSLVKRADLLHAKSGIKKDYYNEYYLKESLSLLDRADNVAKNVYSDQVANIKLVDYLDLKLYENAEKVLKQIRTNSKDSVFAFDSSNRYYEAIGLYDIVEQSMKIYLAKLAESKRTDSFIEKKLLHILKIQEKYQDIVVNLTEYVKQFKVDYSLMPDLADALYHLKFYDRCIVLSTKLAEVLNTPQVKIILANAIRENALVKQGIARADALDFAKYKKLSDLEPQLTESLKWDEGNIETLEILVALNTYYFREKKDDIFKSKMDLYSSRIAKIIANDPSKHLTIAARKISSVDP